jgi:hypothetical protein
MGRKPTSKQLVTEARGIEFKLPKGIFYRIEPSRFDQPWGIILFRYPQNPQIVNHPPEYEQVDHLMKQFHQNYMDIKNK